MVQRQNMGIMGMGQATFRPSEMGRTAFRGEFPSSRTNTNGIITNVSDGEVMVTKLEEDDLKCLAAFILSNCSQDSMRSCNSFRHDRPTGFELISWMSGEITPTHRNVGSPGQAKEAKKKQRQARRSIGLANFEILERLLDLGDIRHVGWERLVEIGFTPRQASQFMLLSRPECDHIPLDKTILKWMDRQGYTRQETPDSVPETIGEYRQIEFTCRRNMKAAWPWATVSQCIYMIYQTEANHEAD